MKLTQLTHFVTMAEHGNYHSAAKALGISQPALTKSITKLEGSLGVTLFDRARGRASQLTSYGRATYERGVKILDDIDNTRLALELMKKGYSGEIRIGFGATIAPSQIAKIVHLIQDKLGDCLVTIRTGPQHLLLPQLRKGELDLLISSTSTKLRYDDLTLTHMWDDPFMVFMATTHELATYNTYDLSWADRYEWISSTQLINLDSNANVYLGHDKNTALRSKYDVFDPVILAKILAKGRFLSAWPSRSFQDQINSEELKGLIIPAVNGQIWKSETNLVYRKGVENSAAVQGACRLILNADLS